MYRSGSPYLVCEELTDVARHRIPEAVARGVTGSFDYEGALPVVTGTATVLRTIADRLVGHAVRSTRAGSVFFLVRVAPGSCAAGSRPASWPPSRSLRPPGWRAACRARSVWRPA